MKILTGGNLGPVSNWNSRMKTHGIVIDDMLCSYLSSKIGGSGMWFRLEGAAQRRQESRFNAPVCCTMSWWKSVRYSDMLEINVPRSRSDEGEEQPIQSV